MAGRAWLDRLRGLFGSLDFGFFFSGFRQWRRRVDAKVPIVRMFFTERVLGVDGKFFAALQDVCEFFDDKFELLTGEFRTQPDNKTRYLIHGFALHGHYNNAFAGGRQVNLLKLFKNKEDKKIKSKNF